MEAPPAYTLTDTRPKPVSPVHSIAPSFLNGPPPPKYYSLPPTFSIGRKHTPHLIKAAHVKAHLALLHEFSSLRSWITALPNPRLSAPSNGTDRHMPSDKDARWVWFVSLAVERFTHWCESLASGDERRPAAEILPPLDVLMVWHSYMLNPGWYAEDSIRLPIMRNLAKITSVFSESFGADLQAIITSEPTTLRKNFWTSKTGRAFDPLNDTALHHNVKEFPCPKCQKPCRVPYMSADGTGYLQHDFQYYCDQPGCQMVSSTGTKIFITRNLLRARKFVDDLFRETKDLMAYFPGTLRTGYYETDLDKGKKIKKLIHDAVVLQHIGKRPSGITNKDWSLFVLSKTLYDFDQLRQSVLSPRLSETDRIAVERVFSAYADHRPFSVDLVGAVIRQGSFVKKMNALKWTEPNYFTRKEDEVALQHAIARYHAFLDLLSATPNSYSVPTLDIDLAWHTHQLMGSKYNSDCQRCVGRFIDHDDKVSEAKIANAFDTTCVAWKERFGLPYMHCGCPVPGKTIGRRLSNFIATTTTSRAQAPDYLIPLDRADLLSSTHPSDHNSVVYIGNSYHEKRTDILDDQEKRRDKMYKRSQEAKGSNHKNIPHRETDHMFGLAFLMPLPYYYSVSCAANSGHLEVDPFTGGIAACAPTPVAYGSQSS